MDFYGINIKDDLLIDVDNQYDIGAVANRAKAIYAVTFSGEATTALWGDLAEKYTSNTDEVGTVVCVSSNPELDVEECNEELCTSVAGVISKAPGFIMNDGLSEGKLVGLVGRLPVKIMGKIDKKDFIVSAGNGCARAGKKGEEAFKIGICNQSKNVEEVELVECIIK